jgi:hypothetical protein
MRDDRFLLRCKEVELEVQLVSTFANSSAAYRICGRYQLLDKGDSTVGGRWCRRHHIRWWPPGLIPGALPCS